MTPDIAQQLLAELDDLEIRVAVQVRRLPGDVEVEQLRHDLAQHRADVIAVLARWRQVDTTADAATTIH